MLLHTLKWELKWLFVFVQHVQQTMSFDRCKAVRKTPPSWSLENTCAFVVASSSRRQDFFFFYSSIPKLGFNAQYHPCHQEPLPLKEVTTLGHPKHECGSKIVNLERLEFFNESTALQFIFMFVLCGCHKKWVHISRPRTADFGSFFSSCAPFLCVCMGTV